VGNRAAARWSGALRPMDLSRSRPNADTGDALKLEETE
jgi:hypothetical protein